MTGPGECEELIETEEEAKQGGQRGDLKKTRVTAFEDEGRGLPRKSPETGSASVARQQNRPRFTTARN